MGTIATKLEYLNTTKEKIRDSINLTGANIGTSDTFRSYANKLKKGYIDIINNGIDTLYNNFPKVSGIGSNLILTPTYEAPMKLNEIQGDTLQENTPTPDTPVEIQSVTGLQNIDIKGKNLLNIPDGTYSHNGITAVVDNGEITLNGTASGTSFIGINVGLNLVSGTYTLSLNNSATKSDTGTYVRFDSDPNSVLTYENTNASNNITLSENKTYSQLVIRTTSGVSFENFIIKPQLEQGSTATDFKEYKGNTYEVNLGNIELNKIGTYQDRIYKDNGKWYVEKQIGKIVLGGTEEWSTHQFGTNSFQLSFPDVKSGGDYITILSSHFKGIPYTNRNTGNNIIYNDAQSSISLIIRNTGFATLNDFKTWLSSNNVTLEYVLATPTYTEITNTELINQLETLYTAKSQEGTTNISITSEDLEMILNVSALKGDA